MFSRIYSVDTVDLSYVKTQAKALVVNAVGRAATTGWSQPMLSPFIYVVPPSDRILDCDFVATPPAAGGIVQQVLTPIAADLVLEGVDLADFWGPGLALEGVRCHAASNAKTALVQESRPGMPPLRHLLVQPPRPADPLSFETDIRPLFRTRDAVVMKQISNFDLHNYDDVVTYAEKILERLEDRSMPCDGAWPETDIELFRAWIDAGKPQ